MTGFEQAPRRTGVEEGLSVSSTLYIDGAWVPAEDGGTRTITCPADGTEVGVVAEGTREDTLAAIAAATSPDCRCLSGSSSQVAALSSKCVPSPRCWWCPS